MLQVDLLDFFTGDRSWRQFYVFLDRLPTHGHYKATMSMDEEWARRKADAEDAAENERAARGEPVEASDTISPVGYEPILAYLATIADRLMVLRNTLIAVNSEDNAPAFEPLPRPVTALDRERQKRTHNELLDLEAQLFGL